MTQKELTDRYLSDIKSLRTAHENGVLNRDDFDNHVANLDNRFFNDLDMLVIVTPTAMLERILEYS